MAPEIIAKKPYQGQVVDLFALAVILFIMRAGYPPFGKAAEDDQYYQLLATNRSDLFWRAHMNAGNKPEGYFSEEFKDLVTCMLQLRPHQRLCIADIVGHPWLSTGETATAERIRQEFSNRHEINKQRARAEEQRKAAQRNQVKNMPRRKFAINGKVYLAHGEEIDDPEAAANQEIINLRLKQFNDTSTTVHSFFSTFSPSYLLKNLTERMDEEGHSYDISSVTWKLSSTIEKAVVPGQESDFRDSCKAMVEILQVSEQDKYCVNFTRKGGSAMLFYDFVNKLLDKLELCNNATLDE